MPSADSYAANPAARAYAASNAARGRPLEARRPTPRPAPRPQMTPRPSADSLEASSQATRDYYAQQAANAPPQQPSNYYPSHYLSADAEAMWRTPDAESAAINAAIERMNAASNITPAPYVPPTRTSGSGRSTNDAVGSTMAAGPAAFAAPATYTAPPAMVEPPGAIAAAGAGAGNVEGASFTSIGTPGSFGEYERRRQARGPRTGMSVTPEMIRRAASQRLG